MKNRSPIAVLLLPFITLGIYSIYWQVKTKLEMNEQGTSIPTAWLLIIPFVNWWWLWKYSQGVDQITNGKMSAGISFVLLFFLGFIGQAIIQPSFNQVSSSPAPAGPAPAAPAPAAPATEEAPKDNTPPAATPPTV